MVKRDFLIVILLVLSSCSNTDIKSDNATSGPEQMSSEERRFLIEAGEAGQAWAYDQLAAAAYMGAGDGDGRIWDMKALQGNSSHSNKALAVTLLEEARRCPVGSIERNLLLDEAQRRAKIAITNAYSYPQTAREIGWSRNSLTFSANIYREIEAERESPVTAKGPCGEQRPPGEWIVDQGTVR